MRVAAAPFQFIAILIALYGAFIFRESWIQYLCLSTKNTSLQSSTHHGGANITTTTVPVDDVSLLRNSKGKSRAGRIRNSDKSDPVVFLTDQQENSSDGAVDSGDGAQSRTNSTERIPALPTTNKADNALSSNPIKSDETLVQEKPIGELAPLRICRDSSISLNDNAAAGGDALDIPFQCQGPNYNAFSLQLSKYMTNTTLHSTTWGRREVPFAANSSILIIGNHHVGETASSLLCQYKDEIRTLEFRTIKGEGYTVEFKNGAVVEALINSHAVYSKNWKKMVERHLHKSLDSFDALVLGNFNHLNDFLVSILEKQVAQDSGDTELEYTEPPILQQVASVYAGIILAVSSFSNRKQALRESKNMRTDKARLVKQGRTNIGYINGRKFVKRLGIEGASSSRLERNDAEQDGSGHRCNGANGGYPDLMSWEVIERVNGLMENDERHGSLQDSSPTIIDTAVVNENDNENVNDKNDGLLPLHICRVPEISTDPDDPLIMNYQCQGPKYEAFSQRLTDYITDTSLHSSTWGRRPFPLPANKSIFIFGNSHTRQTGIGILCQYQDQLKVLKPRKSGDEGYTAEFKNGAMIESLINNYALYGHNWKDLIEKEIGRPLASFDALVLGKFNRLKDSQNTTFMKEMEEVSKTNPDVDFLHVRPPGLKQVAAVYSGNIVAVGMFSDKIKAEQEAKIMARDEEQLHENGRTNVKYIYGRKFVDIVGLEGGSMNRKSIDDSYEIGMAHRCNGAHGGHSDLMAWEVLENLNELLSLDGN